MFKELYNNKKVVLIFVLIIVFLIFVKEGGMKKTIENFENSGNVIDTITNSFDMTGQKFNDVFSSISTNSVKINKNMEVNNLYLKGHDLEINNTDRKGKGTGPRRALVHDGGDSLTINYGGDYKGGVVIKSDLQVTGKTTLKTSTYWKPGSWQEGSFRNLAYLDRQNVSCNDGDFMSGLKWETSGDKIRMNLKCTKLN